MKKDRVKVEFFVPVPACACSGDALMRDMDKITRLEMMMDELKKRYPDVELVRHDMVDESAYTDNLKALAAYLREAGEEEFASRIAFSLRYVMPAVAVDGRLVAYGGMPELSEVTKALGRE